MMADFSSFERVNFAFRWIFRRMWDIQNQFRAGGRILKQLKEGADYSGLATESALG
jgi:hypothetical protein